jgi:hypothetical protein
MFSAVTDGVGQFGEFRKDRPFKFSGSLNPMFPMFPHPIYVIAVVLAAVLVIVYVRKKRNL